jgi:hypothetical protein
MEQKDYPNEELALAIASAAQICNEGSELERMLIAALCECCLFTPGRPTAQSVLQTVSTFRARLAFNRNRPSVAVSDEVLNLRRAARAVVDRWESGELDKAVRELDHVLYELEPWTLGAIVEHLRFPLPDVMLLLADVPALPPAARRVAENRVELLPGEYSVYLVHEDGTWERPVYRVPRGWTAAEVAEALRMSNRKLIDAIEITRDDEEPQANIRELPDVDRPDREKYMRERVEVFSMPIISTSHLTAEERERPFANWPTHCLESEFGFVVYFGAIEDLENVVEDSPFDWPGFLTAARWASRLGFEWIRFDMEADAVAGLMRYSNWA